MKKLLLSAVAVLLLATPAADAQCLGVISPPPPSTVCGVVWRWTSTGWKAPLASYNVKLCQPGTFNCRSTMTTTEYDGYNQARQAFTFYNWGGSSSQYYQWDLYAWHNSTYYGSSTVPTGRVWISGLGLSGIEIYAPPRPLPPTPYYPANGGSYISQANYQVIWNSGMDAARSAYPVTYEVWFKYWPFGGTEPAQWSLSRANMPCHDNGSGPDANNRCSTTVVDPAPVGNWKWKVVANLDVSVSVPAYMRPAIFKTESSSAYFTWN